VKDIRELRPLLRAQERSRLFRRSEEESARVEV